jgi:small subunit ribosomal protein S6
VLKELERRLRVQELVIKFITVRIDEEEKRLAKVKKLRDAKVKGQGTQGQAAALAAAQAAENAAALAAAAPPAEVAPAAEAETPAEVPPATV